MNVIGQHPVFSSVTRSDDRSTSFGAMDVYLEDQTIGVEINIPGVPEDKVIVQLNKGTGLLISGSIPVCGQPSVFLRRERDAGEFERKLTLPFPVDADKVEAKMKLGVLTLKLPRLVSSLPRRIAINQHLGS